MTISSSIERDRRSKDYLPASEITTAERNTALALAQSLYPFFVLAFLVIIVSGVVSAVLLSYFGLRTGHAPGSFLDGGPQFTMLTLVVALAAYLATLARLLKDRIKALDESERRDEAAVTP